MACSTTKKPAGPPAGGYYLIDSRGNPGMYFRADIDPGDMVAELTQVLAFSPIG